MRLIITIGLLLALAVPAFAAESGPRHIEFCYKVSAPDVPADAKSALAWIPVPLTDDNQVFAGYRVEGDCFFKEVAEDKFGNRFLVVDLTGADSDFCVNFSVVRFPVDRLAATDAAALSEAELAEFLAPDNMVPVDGKVAAEALAVAGTADDDFLQAKLLYDNIVDSVEYDKSGEGWGRGDAVYACDERAGNCTDFHSLFIGEARSLDIPARFTMGFPVPFAGPEGEIGGYHCWAEFFVDGHGWVPIDASEARKHPELAEDLFGRQPADRIAFTRGRDYVLPGSAAGPVNFLVYPHIEIDGEVISDYEKSFSYIELN